MKKINRDGLKKEFKQEEIKLLQENDFIKLNKVKIFGFYDLKETVGFKGLSYLAMCLPNSTEYEPEMFRGLVYKPDEKKDLNFIFLEDGKIYGFSYNSGKGISSMKNELNKVNETIEKAVERNKRE